MNFLQSVSSCLRQYVGFSGRAARSEFWWFCLFQLLISVLLAVVIGHRGSVVSLLLALPSLAVGARRLHDIGRSGWWLLLYLLPLIGSLVLLYWFVQPSEPQSNDYGSVPNGGVVDSQWPDTHQV